MRFMPNAFHANALLLLPRKPYSGALSAHLGERLLEGFRRQMDAPSDNVSD